MSVEVSDPGILANHRARTLRFPPRDDDRGSLLPLDFTGLPFAPRRLFVVQQVPPGSVRGQHAHKRARQLLVCVAGRVEVELRDAGAAESVTLDRADTGLLIEAGVWAAQTYVEPGTVLLVLSSEPYDSESYVRDEVS